MQGANLSDTINDCKIDFGTVDEATTRFFQKTLLQLQTCTFFDFFKVSESDTFPFGVGLWISSFYSFTFSGPLYCVGGPHKVLPFLGRERSMFYARLLSV